MLKKFGAQFATLALTVGLGFLIYFFLLNPNSALFNHPQTLATEHLFSAQLADANGNMQRLSAFKGKIVVVNFWATWCAPCREEMPELSRFYDTYKNKNVVVLGIAIDEPKAVNDFQLETPVTYPILVSEAEGMLLAESLGNTQGVLPYTLIIDANGVIQKRHFGKVRFDGLSAEIKAILAPTPS